MRVIVSASKGFCGQIVRQQHGVFFAGNLLAANPQEREGGISGNHALVLAAMVI